MIVKEGWWLINSLLDLFIYIRNDLFSYKLILFLDNIFLNVF